jgi:hypothetical protein
MLDSPYCCGMPTSRGLPGSNSLFFVSPKKSKQKKGDPMVWVPFAAAQGQPPVLAENGVELELASLRQSLALIRFRLRSSAQPDGWGVGCGSGRGRASRAPASPNPASPPKARLAGPSSADGGGVKGGSCLSRRRVLPTPAGIEQRRLPGAKRKDPDSRVAFSLVTFFWRRKRKLLAAGQPPACWHTTAGRKETVFPNSSADGGSAEPQSLVSGVSSSSAGQSRM